jgi:sodium-dependent dicarboxylate transporter 2/3/5
MNIGFKPGGYRKGEMLQFIMLQKVEMGPIKRAEINALFSFVLVCTLWVLPSILKHAFNIDIKIPENSVALLGAGLLFILPVDLKKWEFTLSLGDIRQIDWDTVLLFAGGLCLGDMIFKTGLSERIGNLLSGLIFRDMMWVSVFLFSLFAIFFTEFTSNTSATHMFLPVLISTCVAAQIPLQILCLPVTYAISCAFMLPIATPPNAIVYGARMIRLTQMIRYGFIMNFVCATIITIFQFLY